MDCGARHGGHVPDGGQRSRTALRRRHRPGWPAERCAGSRHDPVARHGIRRTDFALRQRCGPGPMRKLLRTAARRAGPLARPTAGSPPYAASEAQFWSRGTCATSRVRVSRSSTLGRRDDRRDRSLRAAAGRPVRLHDPRYHERRRLAVAPTNANDVAELGIEVVDSWMSTANLPCRHGWTQTREEKTGRERSDARRAESQNPGDREPASWSVPASPVSLGDAADGRAASARLRLGADQGCRPEAA